MSELRESNPRLRFGRPALCRLSYHCVFHQAAEGFGGSVLMMLSNGGVVSAEDAAQTPIRLVESGPAAGAVAERGREHDDERHDERRDADMPAFHAAARSTHRQGA